jgi:hypothetical protein
VKTKPSAAARRLFPRAAMLVLLALSVAATAYGDCHMDQPGDAEGLLTDWLNGKPPNCIDTWTLQIDPAFHSWPMGSQNKPVVTAALGLYKSGPDANLDWRPKHKGYQPVPNPTGYQITYMNWWIWYLASQVGENPKDPTYLGATFNGPPEGSALKYFKGMEELSNFYDTADAVAVVAVRYWAYKYGYLAQDQNKVAALKRLTQKYLRVNLALYGMGAGENPAYKYSLGSDTRSYDPNAPRHNGDYNYNGHFIALAGARSELVGHWGYDYRALFYDRAIGQFRNYILREKIKNPEYPLLDKLESLWNASPPPDDEGNLYGLTAGDRNTLVALLQTCYRDTSNPPNTICSGSSFASNFQSWLKNTFQPWLGNIRFATTYRILGANGWRASMMAENTDFNTTNIYAEYYDKDALDNGTHAQATFLFPWNDANGSVAGSCTYDPSTGYVEASHPDVIRPDRHGHMRTVHPAKTVFMYIPTEPPLIQLVLTPEGPPVFNSSAVAKSLANVSTPFGTDFGNDDVWVGNSIPEGGVAQSAYESWDWEEGDPPPYTEGNLVHLSSPVAGMHQHFFTGATDSLTIGAGDTLYAYVFLDPTNPPSEVMLQWFDPSDPNSPWEHRAYWGANFIGWGTDGQNSRRYMGALPATGEWIRLEAPASLVGLEGRTITGMAFTLYNGQAEWDQAGKNSLVGPPVNVAPGGAATQSSTYLSYTGASRAIDGNSDGNFFDYSVTHTNADYQAWWQVDLGAGYAIDTVNVWNRSDCCPERLSNFYILVSDQPFASANLASVLSQPGVTGYYIAGQGGYPTAQTIQRTGRYVRVQLTGTNYLSLAEVEVLGRPVSSTPPSQPGLPASDVVWVEDSVPSGATTVSGGWNWIASGPPPVSGMAAHQQSALMAGPQQHFFYGTPNTLTINPGDKLMAYVYLDPQYPPSEIMLQWYDPSAPSASAWEHRAYWGANLITQVGADGTDSRRFMGALPPVGQWVRLEVPASQVGLEGHAVSGMAFTQWDGIVTWDRAGKNAQSFPTPPPSGDNVWVEDSLPAGSTTYVDNDSWTWNNINPTPVSGSLANQSNVAAGMHQHYFYSSGSTLQVNTGDKMVAYVYIDPQNPPSEIMLQWHDPLNDWNHRAYWGADQLAYFGTRYNMGAMPAAGQWVRLEAPASLVGLEGTTVNGMAFTLFGGRATWDHAGKRP